MADHLDEQVSALVDGELSEEECKRVMDSLRNDPQAGSCWGHYHLISDVLKNKLPDKVSADFAARVSQILDSEPPMICVPSPRALPRSSPNSFANPAIGFALAASVAAVAYLGFGGMDAQQPAVTASPQLASTAPLVATPVVAQAPHPVGKVRGREWDVREPAVASKLNDYLLSHGQYSAVAGMQRGVMPQVRIVGYQRPEDAPIFGADVP